MNALEPMISAKTLEFHYGKHHQTYIDNLNKLIAGTDLENQSLEEIIKATANNPEKTAIFNNAAQVFNHDFYWASLKPNSGASGVKTLELINASFESLEKFKEVFKTTALAQFGSGWVWLVIKEGKLEIIKTANAATPLELGLKPLFVVDVWEHAYYLDYQNRRADYLQALLDNLINWEFLEANLA